jgi:transcriptional regulator with XRE-family HTH domain
MFYQRLHKICKNKGITVTKMVKELGLSSANMSNWKNGRLPKTEIAFKIANYLDISVYELMGEEEQENKKSPEELKLNEGEKMVLDLFRQIPKERQRAFLEMGRLYADSLK